MLARTGVPFQAPFEAASGGPHVAHDALWSELRRLHPDRPASLCDDWNSALLRAVEASEDEHRTRVVRALYVLMLAIKWVWDGPGSG